MRRFWQNEKRHMLRLRREGYTNLSIAAEMGMPVEQVNDTLGKSKALIRILVSMRTGQCWLGTDVHSKLSKNDVRAIRRDWEGGYSYGEIARCYAVSKSIVADIVKGRRRANVQ